jgi:hypothetical protein
MSSLTKKDIGNAYEVVKYTKKHAITYKARYRKCIHTNASAKIDKHVKSIEIWT